MQSTNSARPTARRACSGKPTGISRNLPGQKWRRKSGKKSGKNDRGTFFSHVVLCVFFAFGNSAVQAHHAFATEFDANRPLTFKGKVTKVELINPHSWIHIEVLDDSGNPVTWMIEGGSPNALVRRGVTKASIPVGSELIVTGYQARDGSNKAVGRDIAFADGRELFFEGSRAPAADKATP